jgi:polygalacturonase
VSINTSSDGATYMRSSGASRPAAAARSWSPSSQSVFSLDRYGTSGNGRHDDTQ